MSKRLALVGVIGKGKAKRMCEVRFALRDDDTKQGYVRLDQRVYYPESRATSARVLGAAMQGLETQVIAHEAFKADAEQHRRTVKSHRVPSDHKE